MVFIFVGKTGAFKEVYPFLYSMIGFFPVFITVSISYFFQHLIFPDKYKNNLIIFGQMAFLAVLIYVFMTPVYLVATSDEWRILVFFVQVLFTVFAMSILTELLASYRYVLLGVYGSFTGLLVCIFLSVCIFVSNSAMSADINYSQNNLYILIGSILLVSVSVNTIRVLFEAGYFALYNATGTDYLGDIFEKIETREKDVLLQARQNLEQF